MRRNPTEEQQRAVALAAGLASGVAAIVAVLVVGGFRGHHLALLPVLMIVGGAVVGLSLAARRARELAAAPPARPAAVERATIEHAALEVAAERRGFVTAESVTMKVRDLTIAEARQTLDDLAAEGVCEVEAGPRGRVFYRFDLDLEPDQDRLAPEEWVERESARLERRDR